MQNLAETTNRRFSFILSENKTYYTVQDKENSFKGTLETSLINLEELNKLTDQEIKGILFFLLMKQQSERKYK